MTYEPPREVIHAQALCAIDPRITPDMLTRPLAAGDEYIYGELARGLSQRSDAEKSAVWVEYERIVLRELGLLPSPEEIKRLLGEIRQSKSRMVLYDDVVLAFTALRDTGLLIGLVSNAERAAHSLMETLGLTPWLKVIVTSSEVGCGKPDPRIFQAALRRAGARPEEAVYVGDQYRIDVAGARSARMTGILLDRGGCFDDIKDCPVIRTLTEVPSRIAAL